MKSYVLYIDYKATSMYEYIEFKANHLADAMAIADKMVSEKPYEAYLYRIMVKDNDSLEKVERGLTRVAWNAFICNRGHGWHPNTFEYSEGNHRVWEYRTRTDKWFDMD